MVIINRMGEMRHQQEEPYHQELEREILEHEMEEEIPKQQPLEIVQHKDQENLQPPKKGIIPQGEQRFLPQQVEES